MSKSGSVVGKLQGYENVATFRVIIFHYFSALPYIQLYMFAAVKYNQMIPAMLTIMLLSTLLDISTQIHS